MNLPVLKKRFLAFLTVLTVPLALMLLYSCSGSSSYSTRSTAPQVMINAATLNNWVTNGYGTDANGYNKLVILDVDSASSYGAGHIPGSYNLDTGSDLQTARSNGVVSTVSQVPTKEMMDSLIQRTGIDEHTVVALVGNGTMMNVGRAYFNFRYWGFPKERLKVMDGTKSATYQGDYGYSLTTAATPDPTPSTYSVSSLTPDVSVRASLEDMIGYAQDSDPFTVIIDARSDDEYNGVARKTTGSTSGTYVAFEGHVKTAEHLEYVELHQGDNRANPLRPENELIAAMAAINLDEDGTGISYCRTSWRAAIHFLALDAVLGWKAQIYDGAWIQWGQMASNDPAIGGALDPSSPWRTDNSALSEDITYNKADVLPMDDADPFVSHASWINEYDKAICGTTPAAPLDRPVDVMVSAATLNGWVEGGYGTDSYGYSKLVILDVDSASSYAGGHIPGSYNLDTGSDLQTTRSNGIGDTVSQVPTKEMMDGLIQRTGIDAQTVVAFVGNGTMMNVGRAYFNFRYWGFPKERLRVMNGTKNATYRDAAGYSLATTETPLPTPSTFSVCSLRQDTSVDGFRASFEEMLAVSADNNPATVVVDARSANEYDGVVGSTSVSGQNYVAFEGHVRTAEHLEYVELHQGGNRANPLLSAGELQAALTAIGAGPSTTLYSYCRTSWRAAIHFLAADAVLGWPAKIYDGAWIQWGRMATNDPAYGGSLSPTSPWRADNGIHSDVIVYNKPEIMVDIDQLFANSFAPHANLINVEDSATAVAGGGSGAGAGGSDKPDAPGYN